MQHFLWPITWIAYTAWNAAAPELESGHSSSPSLPFSLPTEKCFHIDLCYSWRAAGHISLPFFFFFSPHLLKCINSGFLLDCLSVCWGEGEATWNSSAVCAPGYVSSGQMWVCFACFLRSTKSHTQMLPSCVSRLPPATQLPVKNPGIELLMRPEVWYLQQVNSLLVVQLCKKTSSLTLWVGEQKFWGRF